METRQRILLLDDDPDLLLMYGEILRQLPSAPEVHTATSGPRALALLESFNFLLLISDLKMPKMDGLQVLSIVRRKHPELRTAVLTSVVDEQFRSRVYALGVDLYWQKPTNEQEVALFRECIESLLDRNDTQAGFRGVQSKSLVDIVQLECLAQSSIVLRITNGPLIGKLWINDGQLVDAETDNLRGEDAFRKILSWRTGSFETLPAEPSRAQTIFKSYNALLLETAQALDEAHSIAAANDSAGVTQPSKLRALSQVEGVEFALATPDQPGSTEFEAIGLDNAGRLNEWARQTQERFRALSEKLHAGPLEQIEGMGPQRHVTLAAAKESILCIGWNSTLEAEDVRERMKKVVTLWGS